MEYLYCYVKIEIYNAEQYNIILCRYLLHSFFTRDQFGSYAMELIYSANLIFVITLNILFFFSGICLNSLVIVSFWRSVQLRKRLCYFTIMVLSCCDLLVVLTNHPFTGLVAMLWLTEKSNVFPGWLMILRVLSFMSIGSSLVALFVMNFDQYLATHCPIFHRTSVTKGNLLTLFTFLVIFEITVTAMSTNDFVISHQVCVLIICIIFIFPMLFINYKLLTIARKSRRNNQMKKSFSLKNIIMLLAGNRLSNGVIHSIFGLCCTKTNFQGETKYSR